MIVYRSFLNQRTGYSLAAAMDVLALAEAGVDFKTCTLSPRQPVDLRLDLFGRAQKAVAERHDPRGWELPGVQFLRAIPTDALAPYDRARSETFPVFSGRRDQRFVCATVFEAPVWPAGWGSSCNLYDRIVLPGEWLAQAARARGVVSPITVVPHAMEWPPEKDENGLSDIPPPFHRAKWWWERPSRTRDGYGWRGLHVFADGTHMLRKNLSSAVEAFWRAFDHDDGAVMLLKTSWFAPVHEAIFMHELHEIRRRLGRTRYAPVGIIDSTLTWSEHWGLFRWCTCYLSMAYAEGVGLPLIQAGGLGKPIVCTHGPGHLDTAPQALFVNSRDAIAGQLEALDPLATLDRCDNCDRHFGVAHIHHDDPWRVPSIEHAAELLRTVHMPEHVQYAQEAAKRVRERHGLAQVGAQLARIVREVEAS